MSWMIAHYYINIYFEKSQFCYSSNEYYVFDFDLVGENQLEFYVSL